MANNIFFQANSLRSISSSSYHCSLVSTFSPLFLFLKLAIISSQFYFLAIILTHGTLCFGLFLAKLFHLTKLANCFEEIVSKDEAFMIIFTSPLILLEAWTNVVCSLLKNCQEYCINSDYFFGILFFLLYLHSK